MVTRSLSKLAAVAGGLALSVLAGAGIASADPDLGAAINTTCSYPQVVAALNAQSPAAAAKFQNSHMAQGWLQQIPGVAAAAARGDGTAGAGLPRSCAVLPADQPGRHQL